MGKHCRSLAMCFSKFNVALVIFTEKIIVHMSEILVTGPNKMIDGRGMSRVVVVNHFDLAAIGEAPSGKLREHLVYDAHVEQEKIFDHFLGVDLLPVEPSCLRRVITGKSSATTELIVTVGADRPTEVGSPYPFVEELDCGRCVMSQRS